MADFVFWPVSYNNSSRVTKCFTFEVVGGAVSLYSPNFRNKSKKNMNLVTRILREINLTGNIYVNFKEEYLFLFSFSAGKY